MSSRLLPWTIAALYLAFLFPSPEFPIYNADDGSWFVTMGWNLANFGRYSSDTFPLDAYGHHAAWPPLFAGLLGGVIKIFGINWVVFKLLMVSFGLAALALLDRLLSAEEAGRWAVLLTALSPAFFLFSHHTMTEVPYMTAVAAALLGLSRAESAGTAFLAGLLAVLAFFTRGYAVIFLPAGLLYFMLRPWPLRQRILACAAYALPLLVAILAWKGYTSHVLASQPLDWITTRFGNGSGILQDLLRSPREYAQRLYWHDLRYPAHFLLPLIPLEWVRQHDFSVLLSCLLLALACFGWLVLLRRRRGALECWLPLALVFLMVPRAGAARYWLPFLPFLYYYLLHGALELGRHLPRLSGIARVLPYPLLLVAGFAMIWHLTNPDRLRFATPESKDYRDIALWAGANLPVGAVVYTPLAHRFLATSGRLAWASEQSLETFLHNVNISSGRPMYALCSTHDPARICAEQKTSLHSIGSLGLFRIAP